MSFWDQFRASKPEALRKQLDKLPIVWRGERKCGHPRTLVDLLRPALEDHEYIVDHWEGELKAEPISGVAEFDGALIGRHDYSGAQDDKGWFLISLVLVPLLIGIPLLLYVRLHHHRRVIGISWRGEAYEASGQAGTTAEYVARKTIISEVRFVIRAGVGHPDGEIGIAMNRGSPIIHDHPKLDVDIATLMGSVESLFPTILPGK